MEITSLVKNASDKLALANVFFQIKRQENLNLPVKLCLPVWIRVQQLRRKQAQLGLSLSQGSSPEHIFGQYSATQQYSVTVLLGDLLGRAIQFNYTVLPVVTGWIKQEQPQQCWFQTLPRLGQGTWQTPSLNVFWSHSRREQGLVKAQTAETERETSAASISIWLS